MVYGDSTTRRAKAVAIGYGFLPEERMTDPEGWYLFLKGRNGLSSSKYLLLQYEPPKNSSKREM